MTSQTIASLTVRQSEGKEQIFSILDGQTLKLGRDEGNDIVVQDSAASRLHATISASTTGVVIADRSSLNGTFVNGQRLQAMKDLSSGDIIDIGACKIVLEVKSQAMVDSLSSQSASRAMTAQMRPISVTVMVASVPDYYAMTEKIPAEDTVKMLVKWCDEVKEIVAKNQGVIDKVIESSLVAVWSGNEKEQQAIQSIYSVQQVFKSTRKLIGEGRWQYQPEFPWRIGVAVSSGLGLQGALGATAQQSESGFTIVGDPVNEAFTLLSHIKSFNVQNIISAETARMAASLFGFTKLGAVPDKDTGKDNAVYSLDIGG